MHLPVFHLSSWKDGLIAQQTLPHLCDKYKAQLGLLCYLKQGP